MLSAIRLKSLISFLELLSYPFRDCRLPKTIPERIFGKTDTLILFSKIHIGIDIAKFKTKLIRTHKKFIQFHGVYFKL
ncbi:unnamed protein product [Caenorhabditis brenneri]